MADPGQSSITVAVRVRPFTIREAAQIQRTDDGTLFLGDGSLAAAPTPKLNQRGIRNVIKVMDERCLVFDPPEDNPVHKFGRSVVPTSRKVKDQVFAFDRVFDANTTQSDVYEGTTRALLDNVLDGYNATVFAYGATGCGKTHTITGTAQQPGIIFLTMQELFEKIDERSQDKSTELSLSYLEIYNETIRDLLVPGGGRDSKLGLALREDSNQAVSVSGLTSHHPKDVQEVMDMIVQGNEYRTVSPTEANATSSRSHAVLQINIAQKDRNADISEPHTMATLSIIDLAGSERASVTKNRGERLTEGANINKSLLALGSCINALCDRRGRVHVPYRNSKLTRLLKFSLGGNCKTVMIVCVSPSSFHFDETQNTLRYANRAKNIQTKVTRNVFNVNRHVKDFLVKIDEQIALINELKAQQKDAEKMFYAKFRKQYEKRDIATREGVQRLRNAYDNCAGERQERINSMKRLKGFERRIALLSGWISAFDVVCSSRGGDDDKMPLSLVTIRKTANGILIELETSRQHIHQKLDKSTWEHNVDTALSHSIKQLEGVEGSDTGEINTLNREAEFLKTNFTREAYREVLEQEKVGDAGIMQMLLTAQFEMMASLSDTLNMDQETAVAHAKDIIHGLLESGFNAASQVVKPDGGAEIIQQRPATPKMKKKISISIQHPTEPTALELAQEHGVSVSVTSPTRQSPRRRKVLGAAKKGVTFTPLKKRGVRWRDDENDQATLADFEKTPQMMSKPRASLSPGSGGKSAIPRPTTLNTAEDESYLEESTLNLEPPVALSLGGEGKTSSRFQAGFLSKPRASLQTSPRMPAPPSFSLSLPSSSPDFSTVSPLRSLDVSKAGNMSPPPPVSRGFGGGGNKLETILDENCPPPSSSLNNSGSDSESSLLDPKTLRNAMHSAKKDMPRRMSVLTPTGGGAHGHMTRRASASVASSADRGTASRPSMPTNLASSINGISRQRRGSLERKKSPLACSPSELKKERSLTAGQARRMNLGGSVRLDTNSPKEAGGPRRVTISMGGGVVAGGQKKMSTSEIKGGALR